MTDLIDERLAKLIATWKEGMVAPVEATRLVAKLRKSKPDELAAWLDEHAERIVEVRLQQALGKTRQQIRRDAGPRAFQRWTRQFERNEPIEPVVFEIPYCVNTQGAWKRFGDMTREDCLFVAEDRHARVKEQLLEEAFMRAVAKRLMDGEVVADRFDAAEIERLNGTLAA